jgi:hypothetical protein
LVIIGFLFFGLFFSLCGCAAPETGERPDLYWEGDAAPSALAPPERLLSEVKFRGPLINITEGGSMADTSGCHFVADEMHMHFKNLDTERPRIVGLWDVAFCDKLDEYTNLWILHCEEYFWCETCFPWYWVYYDVYLERVGWEEKEYIGWVYWTIDLDEYFWCTYNFRVTEIKPEYAWQ